MNHYEDFPPMNNRKPPKAPPKSSSSRPKPNRPYQGSSFEDSYQPSRSNYSNYNSKADYNFKEHYGEIDIELERRKEREEREYKRKLERDEQEWQRRIQREDDEEKRIQERIKREQKQTRQMNRQTNAQSITGTAMTLAPWAVGAYAFSKFAPEWTNFWGGIGGGNKTFSTEFSYGNGASEAINEVSKDMSTTVAKVYRSNGNEILPASNWFTNIFKNGVLGGQGIIPRLFRTANESKALKDVAVRTVTEIPGGLNTLNPNEALNAIEGIMQDSAGNVIIEENASYSWKVAEAIKAQLDSLASQSAEIGGITAEIVESGNQATHDMLNNAVSAGAIVEDITTKQGAQIAATLSAAKLAAFKITGYNLLVIGGFALFAVGALIVVWKLTEDKNEYINPVTKQKSNAVVRNTGGWS
jgi:hypothetical protein